LVEIPMKHTLLLGPGRSRHRIHGGPYFGSIPTERITVADYSQDVLAQWGEAELRIPTDLRHPPFLFAPEHYDEVHAYEILNLLPGDAFDFFNFWRSIHDCMKPGANFYATVPHWQSQWVHAYPGPQRTYTPGLLTYLDHNYNIAAKEDFDQYWPPSYNQAHPPSWEIGDPPQGFQFVLVRS
jgi:hypothetical protein